MSLETSACEALPHGSSILPSSTKHHHSCGGVLISMTCFLCYNFHSLCSRHNRSAFPQRPLSKPCSLCLGFGSYGLFATSSRFLLRRFYWQRLLNRLLLGSLLVVFRAASPS